MGLCCWFRHRNQDCVDILNNNVKKFAASLAFFLQDNVLKPERCQNQVLVLLEANKL